MRQHLKELIPELSIAYNHLELAVQAHLAGNRDEAASNFARANCPVVWDWLDPGWHGVSKHVVEKNPPGDSKEIPEAERYVPRMVPKDVQKAALARDGYCCRYCGLPVVDADIRRIAHTLYPSEVPWEPNDDRNQHSAFQAFWLQFDHVIPHSHGGPSTIENVVVSCALCNFGKFSYTLRQLNLEDPRQRPPVPTRYDGLERFRAAYVKTKSLKKIPEPPRRTTDLRPEKIDATSRFFFAGAWIKNGYLYTPPIAGKGRWFRLSDNVAGFEGELAGVTGCFVECQPELLRRRGLDPSGFVARNYSTSSHRICSIVLYHGCDGSGGLVGNVKHNGM